MTGYLDHIKAGVDKWHKEFEAQENMNNKEEKAMTLAEQIKKIDPEAIVSLQNSYGVFWTGKAKFVFGAVTWEAWNGTHIKVIM